MDLGTPPLFDLPAPLGAEVVEPAAPAASPAALTRSQELVAEIQQHRQRILDEEIATVRAVAEWALEHVVSAEDSDASPLTERGLDTGLPLARPGAPLISDFAVMDLAAALGRSLDSARCYVGQVLELARHPAAPAGPTTASRRTRG